MALLLGAAMLAPRAARAQDDAATRDAQARVEEGLRRYRQSDFEGARLAFVQAFVVLQAADVLWNLCLAELRANRPLDALKHLKEYVRDPRVSEADRVTAKKFIDEAMGRTGHIKVEAPARARIRVNRLEAGEAPLAEALDVEAGAQKHFVEVVIGDKTRKAEISVDAGQTIVAKFDVDENKGAVVVAGAGGARKPDGETRGQHAADPPSSPTRTITAIAMAGVGVVSIGAGIGFFIGAGNQKDAVDQARAGQPNPDSSCFSASDPGCASRRDAAEAKTRDKNLGTGLVVGGAAFLAGAVATWFFWPHDEKANARAARTTWVSPIVTAGGAGAQVGGSF